MRRTVAANGLDDFVTVYLSDGLRDIPDAERGASASQPEPSESPNLPRKPDGSSACGGLRMGLARAGRSGLHRAAADAVVFCLRCRAVGPRRRESAALRQRQGHARYVRRKPCARTWCNGAHRPSCVVCCIFCRLCIVYRVSCIFRYSRCVARREPSRSYVLRVVCVSRQRCIRMRGPQCATRPCLGTFACRERALLRWLLGLPAFAPPAEPRVRCRLGGRCAFMPVPVDVATAVYPALPLPLACGAAAAAASAPLPVSLLGLRRRVGASPALLPRTRQVRRAWRSRRVAGARFGLCNAALPPSPAFLA